MWITLPVFHIGHWFLFIPNPNHSQAPPAPVCLNQSHLNLTNEDNEYKYKQHRLGNALAILWRTHHTIREDWEVGIHNAVWKITGYTLFTRVYPALHLSRLSNCLQIHTLCVILELYNVHCCTVFTVYHHHFCHSNVMTLDRSAVHCSPL